MVEPNLNAYLQNQIKQAQDLQAQIEQVANQRYQLDLKVKELDKTLKELNNIGTDTPVYKNVGPVIYKIDDKKQINIESGRAKRTWADEIKNFRESTKINGK